MEFLRRASIVPSRVGILSAAFNPPTKAHLGLARSALRLVDEVLFVMPRRFPHKEYEGVGLDERLAMVAATIAPEPRFSAGVTDGGLFIEIARECREAYGVGVELWFLCGRDAAERIVNWDYGDADEFDQQLEEYGLLVADRDGAYKPPQRFSSKIHGLALDSDYSGVSSSAVREAAGKGGDWRGLVPGEIEDAVERLYCQ